jgi:protein-glutamine gamma-glutamyltransferase
MMKRKMAYRKIEPEERQIKSPKMKTSGMTAALQRKGSEVDHIFHLQKFIGNRAVQRMIKYGALQHKRSQKSRERINNAEVMGLIQRAVADFQLDGFDRNEQDGPEMKQVSSQVPSQTMQRVVQRKLIINGEEQSGTDITDLLWEHVFDTVAEEIIERMHNEGNPPTYSFDSKDQFETEMKVRANAIEGMEEVHRGCCNYPSQQNPDYINDTYWVRMGRMYFVPKSPLPQGTEASDAIEAIFANGAGTRLDCWTIMVAIEYYALLQGVGKEKFNQMFPGGAGIEISWRGTTNWPNDTNRIFTKYKSVNLNSSGELLPGDWVYFRNFRDYLRLHPGGYLQGENAIYMGDGKFKGFGSGLKTENEMNQWLRDACYPEETLIEFHSVEDLKDEGGGLQLRGVKRPDSDQIGE